MDLSATHLRHPLACKKFMMEFEDQGNLATPSAGGSIGASSKRLEPFELFSRYTAVRPIAKGTYGYVIAARDAKRVDDWHKLPAGEREPDPESGLDAESLYDQRTLVAIKKVPQLFESGEARMWLCAAREAQMLLHFRHENVVSATDVFIPLGPEHLATAQTMAHRSRMFNDLYIVMEHKDMSLRQVLRQNTLKNDDGTTRFCPSTGEALCGLTRDYRQFLLYQMLRGVGYLHKCRVMHRDLKPENVLVDLSYRCCICDFGQAKDLTMLSEGDDADTSASPLEALETLFDNCTQWYAAPETLTLIPESSGSSGFLNDDVLHSADVWSVGAIAAEMLIGRPLFHTRHGGGFSQLRAIIDVRGRIGEDDVTALTLGRHDEDRAAYVNVLGTTAHSQSRRAGAGHQQCDFKTFLKAACPTDDAEDDELELIENLLQYRPAMRLSPQQALEHRFFTSSDYEATVDPDSTAQPLKTVGKDEIRSESDARRFFWDMFLSLHGEVQQLNDVLAHQGTP